MSLSALWNCHWKHFSWPFFYFFSMRVVVRKGKSTVSKSWASPRWTEANIVYLISSRQPVPAYPVITWWMFAVNIMLVMLFQLRLPRAVKRRFAHNSINLSLPLPDSNYYKAKSRVMTLLRNNLFWRITFSPLSLLWILPWFFQYRRPWQRAGSSGLLMRSFCGRPWPCLCGFCALNG